MKKNLIIFLFTLFLGGISCFNFSYASTVVNVSESFCKKIQNEYSNKESSEQNTGACVDAGCIYIEQGSKCVACPGIRLNTNIPFIGNCIPTSTQTEVFPVFIGGLIQFTMSLLVLIGFICIIIGGVKISLGDSGGGRDLIMKVVYAMAALGASGVILKIINPNFFS